MPELQEVLRRIAKEMDDDDAKAQLDALKGRKVTVQDIKDAISEAPVEERAHLRQLLAEELDDDADPKPKPKSKAKPDDDDATDDDTADDDDDDTKPSRKIRPGRKRNHAYQWYVDDEGKVMRSSTAVIYSGDDEPDEVELLPDDDDDTGDDE